MQCLLLCLKNAFHLFVWNFSSGPPVCPSLLSFMPLLDGPSCFQVGAFPHTSVVFVHGSRLMSGTDKLTKTWAHKRSLLTGGTPCGLRETSSLLSSRGPSMSASRVLSFGGMYTAANALEAVMGRRSGALTVKHQGSHIRLPVFGAARTRVSSPSSWRKEAPVSAHRAGGAGGCLSICLVLLHPMISGLSFPPPLLPVC